MLVHCQEIEDNPAAASEDELPATERKDFFPSKEKWRTYAGRNMFAMPSTPSSKSRKVSNRSDRRK
jgi:hypothetical protein